MPLFFILTILISIQTHASVCRNLFSAETPAIREVINDLLLPSDAKRRLLINSAYNSDIKSFVIEHSTLLDKLFENAFAEIVAGTQFYPSPKSLGFGTPEEVGAFKQSIFNKQFIILSLMPASDITEEFKKDFEITTRRVYDRFIKKPELQTISNKLDQVILEYSLSDLQGRH